jgi:predicted ATPase
MLVNYRPEYRHGWGSKTHYAQLRLDPLGGQSADEMLQALLGGDASLRSLKRLIIDKTQGNPFFMELCGRWSSGVCWSAMASPS